MPAPLDFFGERGEMDRREWSFLDILILRSAGIPAHRLLAVTAAPDGKAALRAAFAKPDLEDALWLNSPDLLGRVQKVGGGGSARQDRKLYAYLQRFCAKNDTLSAYGPVSYLHIGAKGRAPQRGSVLSAARKQAKLSHWACLKLAGALTSQAAIAREAPLVPAAWIDADELAALTPPQREMVETIGEAPCSLALLWTRHGPGSNEVHCALSLIEQGLLVPSLCPHPISTDGLEEILRALGAMTGEAAAEARKSLLAVRRGLLKVERARGAEARGAAEKTLGERLREAAPGQDWSAPEGDPDRRIFFEDAYARNVGLRLDPESWSRIVRQLQLPLRIMAARAVAKRRDWQEWCRESMRAQGLRGRVSLESVIACVAAGRKEPQAMPHVEAFDAAQAGLLRQRRGSEDELELDAAAAEMFLADWVQPLAAFASPDLLFDRDPSKGGRMILGEVHGGCTVWSFLLKFLGAARREALRAKLASWLSGLEVTPCELMMARRRGRSFLMDLPVLAIDAAVGAGANAPSKISFRDVTVDLADFSLTDGKARRLEVMRSTWSGALADVLAVEIENFAIGGRDSADTDFVPRIWHNGMVLQRARWSIDAARLKIPLATAPGGRRRGAADKLRLGHELPREIYVSVQRGEKPVYLDLESELSLDWLAHALPTSGHVVLTEALPRPADAWLETGAGRVSAEIRTSAFWG